MMKSKPGFISLLCASTGLCVLAAGSGLHLLHGFGWRLLLAGFTAATVGGIADWFAVHALFHKIKLPLVGKHTNLIAVKRKELTAGVADLVANNWLSATNIKAWLSEIPVTNYLLAFLHDPKQVSQLKNVAGRALQEVAGLMDDREAATVIQGLAKEYFQNVNAGQTAGKWLEKLADEGVHWKIWDYLLKVLENVVNHDQTR